MTAKTHILGGLFFGEVACIACAVSARSSPALLAGAAAGALIPDIDHTGSKISRSSVAGTVASFAVSAFTTHRGVIHTPVFVLAFSALLGVILRLAGVPHSAALLAGLTLGMLSHLALDTLNPGGIMWLWPLSKKRLHLAPIRTSSLAEWCVTALLLALVIWLAASRLPELAGEIRLLLPRFLRKLKF